jgi:predicted membrane channel-forming protein YqfA (hemolysin III family)
LVNKCDIVLNCLRNTTSENTIFLQRNFFDLSLILFYICSVISHVMKNNCIT